MGKYWEVTTNSQPADGVDHLFASHGHCFIDEVQIWHYPSQYTRIARSSICNPHVDRPCPPSKTASRDLSLTQRHCRDMSWTLECAVTPTAAERKVGQTRMRWQAGGRVSSVTSNARARALSVCLAKQKPCGGASGHVSSSRCQNKQSGHTTVSGNMYVMMSRRRRASPKPPKATESLTGRKMCSVSVRRRATGR